ncbi:MAG: hypothetical protein ACOC5T_05870 [Elusimicrobiota bacterium]
MNLPLEPRMYVIVREDLAFKYVQGSHGLAQYALENPQEFREWNNGYLIFLSVFNGLVLEKLRVLLRDEPCFPKFSVFYEPDLKSELPTAICVFDGGKNNVCEHLKTLKLASK